MVPGAHIELARQVAFVGDDLAGSPLAAGDALHERVAQLQIDRPGRELGLRHCFAPAIPAIQSDVHQPRAAPKRSNGLPTVSRGNATTQHLMHLRAESVSVLLW